MNSLESTRIGFIGAGKVGVTLGAYFRSKGLCVGGYMSRNPESSQIAAALTSSRIFTSLDDLLQECGIVMITTPDDQIATIWNEMKLHYVSGHIICHTSGSQSSEVFSDIKDHNAFGYSIHPMHVFTARNGTTEGLEKACFTIEGDGNRLDDLLSLLYKLENKIIIIPPDSKALYHLSNVMVSNLVLALISLGCESLAECGVDGDTGLSALMPLIMSNIDNIRRQGFINSLTGPVERNDVSTVLKHLDVLPQGYEHTYIDLSMKLLELARKKYPERDYTNLFKCLDGYSEYCSKNG